MSEKKEYTASRQVLQAAQAVEEQKKNRPEYRSGYEPQLQELMNRILNREEFHYNLNGDALYRQYRDQAMRDGHLAMADTMGQAAALTGGYGNSYAQSVGQQAYARQLDRLNDRIPELYALALDQYKAQSQGLQQKYDLLSGAEKQDYSRYLDSLAAWQKDADALWKSYTDSRDFDYDQYRDGRDFDYAAARDAIADRQWQQKYDEDKRRYDQEWDAAHPAVAPTVYYSAPAKAQTQEKPKATTAVSASLGQLKKLIGK